MRRTPKEMTRAGLIMVLVVSLAVVVPAWAASGRTGPTTGTSQKAAAPKAAVKAPIHTAAVITINLCALAGTATMADTPPTTVPIWRFAVDLNPGGAGCGGAVAGLPGPTLGVDTATIIEGDTVTVNLENTLTEPVSINFHGQDIGGPPDTVGASTGTSKPYSFIAAAGTFEYEAGTDVTHQIPMGLAGALVVQSNPAGQVFTTSLPGVNTSFNQQAVLVLSEIDPNLNAAVSLGNPFNMLNYKPQFWLINGKSYPQTAMIVAGGGSGWRIDLRYVNAGIMQHTMMLLGAHESFVARDGFPINYPYDLDSETFSAGSTGDAIVTLPSGATAKYALYSRNMDLTNGANVFANTSYSPGGMMTFITVGP